VALFVGGKKIQSPERIDKQLFYGDRMTALDWSMEHMTERLRFDGKNIREEKTGHISTFTLEKIEKLKVALGEYQSIVEKALE